VTADSVIPRVSIAAGPDDTLRPLGAGAGGRFDVRREETPGRAEAGGFTGTRGGELLGVAASSSGSDFIFFSTDRIWLGSEARSAAGVEASAEFSVTVAEVAGMGTAPAGGATAAG
jgi:hypothetical protein